MIITKRSYPRAALIGNPSDGYYGKTIAFTFKNFFAETTIYESPKIEIVPNQKDHSQFSNIQDLVIDVNRYGYYGGLRLLKAAVKTFYEYCYQVGIKLDDRNFTIQYKSNIPHGLGLAGSSAIITAGIRSLMAFYAVDIPKPVLSNIVLSVETDELGIAAGLQDRVAQVYQGLVYMDFAKEIMDCKGYGHYEYLDATLLPELYIAFWHELAESSEKVHGKFRSKYREKDEHFFISVKKWAELTDQVRECLIDKRKNAISNYINENFDLRQKVQRVNPGNVDMISAARSVGASAKFTGSGGAIIGTFDGQEMYNALEKKLSGMGVEIIKPIIADRTE
jgi:glucuronokinase